MSKQLKTMTFDSLLEELSICENEATIGKLKTIAEFELEGQDDVTREVVMKVLYYKQYLICKDETAFSKLIRKNWRLANDSKISFYEHATGFFKQVAISFLVEALESRLDTMADDDHSGKYKVYNSIQALKQFEEQYLNHVSEVRDVKCNRQKALLAGQEQ